MMKLCSGCNTTTPTTDFYQNKRFADGFSYRCKKCDDQSNRQTREASKEQYLGYRRDWRHKQKKRIHDWKQAQGCKLCPETSPYCLELHHLDPAVKEDHPSHLSMNMTRFLKEAEGCVVLCSNCHKKVHAGVLSLPPS